MFYQYTKRLFVLLVWALASGQLGAQIHSVAMQWNETQLSCIRKDGARPTVQARNLGHAAIVMYDAFAAYDDNMQTVFLGQTFNGFSVPFNGIVLPADRQAAQEKAISYAMFRYLSSRYDLAHTPAANQPIIAGYISGKMSELGYDPNITSTDYSDGDPAKLGNYIAAKMQEYALQDGSNQQNNYANQYYTTVNGDLHPQLPGNPLQVDANRWQRLSLILTLDQSTGLPIPNGANALSPEWGNVGPFAMTAADMDTYQRDGHDWKVYHDPGPPPLIDTNATAPIQWDEDFFRWGYGVVAQWHSFHKDADTEMVDISPNTIGNLDVSLLPTTFEEYKAFYNEDEGGDPGIGYSLNPITGQPYEVQMVPKGDFTRVLSEFWADGPQSETPPGHWFFIANYVASHPEIVKRWEGQGPILSDLEWDIRTYLALGGGIHDAAIACWGVKGYYDYTRPIMAIRYMCEHGQCSNPELPSYSPAGMPLKPGFVELVLEGDALAGASNENVGKIKLYTFRGPVAQTGQDGVGWILGENWWTYQKNTFVTPPFAGYYSGHSTYSRTGAEILKRTTGSEFFPGGMAEFDAPVGYLGASPGPTQMVKLQWAKYADASDQCSLSRIYGGLHPPQDDIPGRKVGLVVGPTAFNKANGLITADMPRVVSIVPTSTAILQAQVGSIFSVTFTFSKEMNTSSTPIVTFPFDDASASLFATGGSWTSPTTYIASYTVLDSEVEQSNVQFQITGAADAEANNIFATTGGLVSIDTNEPIVISYGASSSIITDTENGTQLTVTVVYDQPTTGQPSIAFAPGTPAGLSLDTDLSSWSDDHTYVAVFAVSDQNETFSDLGISISGGEDLSGNAQVQLDATNALQIDTQNPQATIATTATLLSDADVMMNAFTVTLTFDEPVIGEPIIDFGGAEAEAGFSLNTSSSAWTNSTTYVAVYDLLDQDADVSNIVANVNGVVDLLGNPMVPSVSSSSFDVDTHNPSTVTANPNNSVVSDASVGSATFNVVINFDEAMNTSVDPTFAFNNGDVSTTLVPNASSSWASTFSYIAYFNVVDNEIEINGLGIEVSAAQDAAGNTLSSTFVELNSFDVDTKNPQVIASFANNYNVTSDLSGTGTFNIVALYSEEMNGASSPSVSFPVENPASVVTLNNGLSGWINGSSYSTVFDIAAVTPTQLDIDVAISNATDLAGNAAVVESLPNFFDINSPNGVEDFTNSTNVRVYPNPISAGKDLNIVFENAPSTAVLTLADLTGKTVWSQKPSTSNAKNMTVSTSGLAAGTYFLRVSNGTSSAYEVSMFKVVVQ